MARPLRIEYEDAFYHVMNRGRGRKVIFPGEAFFNDYLKGLDEAHRRFGIEVHAYCLMNNHYHLLVKTPRGNLGRAMRHIDGLYVQRYNRRKKTDGSLFRGRYKAVVVDASCYLLQASRYIHRNPIETKTPLVTELADYSWSSYPAYISNSAEVPDWLNRDAVYGELGSSHRYSAYKRFVAQGVDEETEAFYKRKNTSSIWGSKGFKEYALGRAENLSLEIDKKGLKTPVPMEVIVERVAKHYHVEVGQVRVTERGKGKRNVARWMAMKLCQEAGGAKLTDIAQYFNVEHYSTVSQSIGRLNRLMGEDSGVFGDYNMLSQDLTR